jgi:hypothetical protein
VLPSLERFDPRKVKCADVRGEAFRNEETGSVADAHWVVEFESDEQPSLTVQIDRLTGAARVYLTLREFGFTAAELCA